MSSSKERATAANKGLPQWGLTCFVDSLVVHQTFVLRMNSSANNPPLRQAPNRCTSPYLDTACKSVQGLKPQQSTAHFGTFARHTKADTQKPTLQKSQNSPTHSANTSTVRRKLRL